MHLYSARAGAGGPGAVCRQAGGRAEPAGLPGRGTVTRVACWRRSPKPALGQPSVRSGPHAAAAAAAAAGARALVAGRALAAAGRPVAGALPCPRNPGAPSRPEASPHARTRRLNRQRSCTCPQHAQHPAAARARPRHPPPVPPAVRANRPARVGCARGPPAPMVHAVHAPPSSALRLPARAAPGSAAPFGGSGERGSFSFSRAAPPRPDPRAAAVQQRSLEGFVV